jgi:hypothetical protein
VLLANVYAGAGLPEGARLYADKALLLSAAAGETRTPFDRATTLAAVARAYSVSGDRVRAKEFLDLAQQAATKLDADERPVFDQLCPKL